MALAHAKYVLNVKFLDVGRKQTSKEYNLVAEDATEASAAAAALLSDIQGVTNLEVLGYSINDVFVEDTVVVPTVVSASRKNILRLVVQLADRPLDTAVLEIPGPLDTLFVGAPGTTNYNVVDLTDALLVAYTDNFRDGATPNASISDGEFMANTGGHIRGFRVHKSSNFENPG